MIFEPLQSMIEQDLVDMVIPILRKKIHIMLHEDTPNIISVEELSELTEEQIMYLKENICRKPRDIITEFILPYKDKIKNLDKLYECEETLLELVAYLNEKQLQMYQITSQYYQNCAPYSEGYSLRKSFDDKFIIIDTEINRVTPTYTLTREIELDASSLLQTYLHEHIDKILLDCAENILQEYLYPLK